MSEQQGYMAQQGNQIGPMTETTLISNIQTGSADAETLVVTAGMEQDRFSTTRSGSATSATARSALVGVIVDEVGAVGADSRTRRQTRARCIAATPATTYEVPDRCGTRLLIRADAYSRRC